MNYILGLALLMKWGSEEVAEFCHLAFKSLKMVRNGTKKVQKMFFVIFGVFEFF